MSGQNPQKPPETPDELEILVVSQRIQFYEASFRNSPHPMAFISVSGRFLAVNLSLCELLGYSYHELTSRNTAEITRPEDCEPSKIEMGKMLDGESTWYTMRKAYITKYPLAPLLWVQLTVYPVRDMTSGEIMCFVKHVQPLLNGQLLRAQIEGTPKVLTEGQVLENPYKAEKLPMSVWLIANWKFIISAVVGCVLWYASVNATVGRVPVLETQLKQQGESIQKITGIVESMRDQLNQTGNNQGNRPENRQGDNQRSQPNK